MIHELKSWPEYFEKVIDGSKRFELRENDRNFQVGDTLHLREYVPPGRERPEGYTGREIKVMVTCLTDDVKLGLQPGVVCMSIHPEEPV